METDPDKEYVTTNPTKGHEQEEGKHRKGE
jgi:hypothetical protein